MKSTDVRDDQLPRGAGGTSEVAAVPAASVLVLRPPLDVLMIRRHSRSSFVPNAWVFPGGAEDPGDSAIARAAGDASLLGAMRVTAVRELFEETGLWLGAPLRDAEQKRERLLHHEVEFRDLIDEAPVDLSQLVWTSHWITPTGIPKRFDTYFFLAQSPDGAVATLNDEAVEVVWIDPAEALERHSAGKLEMVFPTIRNLEALIGFDSIDDLVASRRGADIPAIQPVIVSEGTRKKIVLP